MSEKMSKEFIIEPLSEKNTNDYLDFFDNRAFTDGNPNGPCYCTSPNQTEDEIKAMVSEFPANGVRETIRKYAAEMLKHGRISGYLAFDGDTSIGWCNAADIETYTGFVPDFARQTVCGKTIAVVCFEIAPEYRRKGSASALIDRVCDDAKKSGYTAVEGYARIKDQGGKYDFTGPAGLFIKAGFSEASRQGDQAVMRKIL